MGQYARSFVLLGLLAVTLGCEPAPQTAAGNARDSVLSGTESSKEFGNYVVHFNAINTDKLTAEVARQYGIVRSKTGALLTVNLHRKNADGTTTPITGTVTASAANLNGQFKTMTLRELREAEAIYYLGELQITDGETLTYTVDATPAGSTEPLTVKFMKTFYVDE